MAEAATDLAKKEKISYGDALNACARRRREEGRSRVRRSGLKIGNS
jgi:hypothetical protein